ncbi:MAG: hypothetical protein HON53_18445 [Planctomycetaceae bacterium]|nr:hypothetical protein [Planctomycetaceae bacterium]MBT6155864.1 hypothetical protein [Planctomycetaceae bacterium]MBT6484250.1 hypothetical protein [Planctomycetaceae bacterium]MBT6493199.1 hypothetical protein [Planctomycetaceae bacterium]
MRVQGSGSATWLILFVLGVAAVVGVFGLPQFAPVIASSEHVSGGDQLSGDIVSFHQAGAGESMAQGVEDLFAPFDDVTETGSSPAQDAFRPLNVDRLENRESSEPRITNLFGKSSQQPRGDFDEIARESRSTEHEIADRRASNTSARDRFSPANERLDQQFSADRSDVNPSDERPNRREFDSRFGRDDTETSTAIAEVDNREPFHRTVPADDSRLQETTAAIRQPQTWREVVSRLNSLGIRDYRLSAGKQPNEFHFSCFFSPKENPRVTHRFEAQADEPLLAVQQVLTQIDQSQNRR